MIKKLFFIFFFLILVAFIFRKPVFADVYPCSVYFEFNPSLSDVAIGLKQRILSPDKAMDLGEISP